MPALRFNVSTTTGNLNTVSNAAVTGADVFMGSRYAKLEDLSAYLIITADTASITLTPRWQVGDNTTTYVDLEPSADSPAEAVVVTGAANRTVAVPAPPAVTGYRYARCMLDVAGATGNTADEYSIGYSYRQLR